jgi:hypothetical protein
MDKLNLGSPRCNIWVECNNGRWQRTMQVLEQILQIHDENNGNRYSSLFLGILKFKIDYNFDSLMQ